MSKFVEIRHNGNFVARYEDVEGLSAQEQAEAGVKAMFGDAVEGVAIEPGRPFEVQCKDGFIASFNTHEEADAHMRAMADGHRAHVERGGPAALRKQGIALRAIQDDKDPEFVVIKVGEEIAPQEEIFGGSEDPIGTSQLEPLEKV